MGLRECCGIFGAYCPDEEVAHLTFFALFALQHRGQESAGIAVADGRRIQISADMGLVAQVFDEDKLSLLDGHIAIGHTRYSTRGGSKRVNIQPFVVGRGNDAFAIAHNGNIVNAEQLHEELIAAGHEFRTSSDTEVVAKLISSAPEKTWVDKMRYAMHRLQGAYSLCILTHDCLYTVRDPWGVKPLCFGQLNDGWVVASESCALDHIGAGLVREVEPGEIIEFSQDGPAHYPEPSAKRAACIFEYIYFARPDSVINDRLLYPARQAMGASLADEHPIEVDFAMGVPDSATAAATGYAHQAGIPYSEGLLKNRYVGRTFIQPDQRIRDLDVKLKFNPLPQVLKGKKLVVVDDSIVRGTTTPKVIAMLRNAGAKEIHVRICAPPIRYPCFLGIDFATRAELIAARMNVDEIRRFIDADTLGYLSIDSLVKSVGLPRDSFCLACFTGDYPMPVQLEMDKLALEATVTQLD